MKTVCQKGFTLLELIVAVAVMAVILLFVVPMISSAMQMTEMASRKEVLVDNQKLSQALLRYAARTTKGELPDRPSSRNWGVIDDSGAPEGLLEELQSSGVASSSFNTSGHALEYVKVYRVIKGQTIEKPLHFTTGAKVTLKYDTGVIYQTTCPRSSGCANSGQPNGGIVVTGAGGTTPAFTLGNLKDWKVEGEDYAAVMFNTLQLQEDRLRITLGRLNRLSDRLASFYYARARALPDGSNYFPSQIGGVHPNTQNCNGSWVDLKHSEVLRTLGLDSEEFGVTAWGGSIQYCSDYRLSATHLGNPYYAALRINRNVSDGIAPSANVADNVVITF